MNILRRLDAAALSSSFDRETVRRARPYTTDGSMGAPEILELDDEYVEARVTVQGTRRTPYAVRLEAEIDQYADEVEIETLCSCPVHYQCKHGAALVIVLGRAATPRRPPTWQDDFAGLLSELAGLAPPDHDPPGVALEFSIEPPTAPRHHTQRTEPSLYLRPLRPGAKKGWVKTGLGWTDVPRELAGRRYDPEQLAVLARLHRSALAQGTYWYTGRIPSLGDFGPGVLDLLAQARDAGIAFVTVSPLQSLELSSEPARVSADAVAADHGVSVRLGITHAGRLHAGDEVRLFGDPAHAVAFSRPAGHVVLAPLTPPLSGGPLRALARRAPLVVPAAAADDVPDLLRRLGNVVPLDSSDGSVPLPDRLPPRLRVTVHWESASAAEVRWEWCYGEHRPFPIDVTDAPEVPRDRPAERAALAGVVPPPEVARVRVTDVDVLHLALLELPSWRLVDGLEVVEIDPPEFREADEGPEITFEAAEPAPGDQHTDWLDLEVMISVEGERVPLVDALAALTLEQEFLVLPSGLYVRTDRPEFAQLDDVVRAAAQLHERSGNRVRVGTHDLGLWAQLGDLGIVDAQATEWVRRAQALRDLVELPTPEPTGVVSTLRHYQLDGFHWLAFLWQHGLGGILADDMGLGKTLQVLALVAHTRATEPRPFLVVAPTSVVSAWVGEAARHTPGLRVRAVTASAARRDQSIAELAADADVVVTTYTLLRLEEQEYAQVGWGGLVLDEAQQVKNHQSKAYSAVRKIDAPFRLAVTGTPFENRLLELWSLLSIVTPGLYPRPRDFLDHVVKPVEKQGDPDALRRFTRRIRPFVLRRTKELVADDLPAKQEQVVAVDLGAQHRRLYDTHLAKERQRILGLVDDFDRNRVAILAALTKLRQLALDPVLVDPDHDRVGSAKVDVLVEHLREIAAEGHRALVFSSFTGFLRRVRDRLDAESITTSYLDGATRHRGEVVDQFRSGSTSAFLISLKAGGVGLTLTEADYVFVLDPWWNPAAEAQAVDRAHRIGQTSTVMVYRLVSTDTIEDKVMALKNRKAALFAQVIDGEAGLSDGISADDIRSLFD